MRLLVINWMEAVARAVAGHLDVVRTGRPAPGAGAFAATRRRPPLLPVPLPRAPGPVPFGAERYLVRVSDADGWSTVAATIGALDPHGQDVRARLVLGRAAHPPLSALTAGDRRLAPPGRVVALEGWPLAPRAFLEATVRALYGGNARVRALRVRRLEEPVRRAVVVLRRGVPLTPELDARVMARVRATSA